MVRPLLLLSLLLPLTGCATPATSTTPETTVLLSSSKAWDGTTYRSYPTGQPQLTLLKIHIPPHTTLAWHSHPIPNAGYILSGELQVETPDGNASVLLKAGDALAEIVGGVHRGKTTAQATELIVFYAGNTTLPLTQPLTDEAAAASTATAPSPLTALLLSVEQRASIASIAAENKWKTGQPVEDRPRERQVIANAMAQAARHGLDTQRVERFFSDQIEASKLLQYDLMNVWHANRDEAPDSTPGDLPGLRKALDQMQEDLLKNLAEFDRTVDRHQCSRLLAQTLEADGRRSHPEHLAMIRATASLCLPQ